MLRARCKVRPATRIARRLYATAANGSDASSAASAAAAVRARVGKGIAFEQEVVRVMHAIQCELVPTQASQDGGVDHQGVWRLPDMEIEVLSQCKNEQKAVGVQALRAFLGVLSLHPPTSLGLFFSASGFTLYAQRFFARMPHAAILCSLDAQSRFTTFCLNDRARALLPLLSVGSVFLDSQHHLCLTYADRVLL